MKLVSIQKKIIIVSTIVLTIGILLIGYLIDYIIQYNQQKISAETFNNEIFSLILGAAMFTLVPIALILATIKKSSSIFIGIIFTFIPSIFLFPTLISIRSVNDIFTLLFNMPFLIILILFTTGVYVLVYPVIYNKNRPHYIKLNLTNIIDNTAYFSGGLRTLGRSMYHMKIKKEYKDFFQIGCNYKVNISPLGIINDNDPTDFSRLKKSDFIKLD